MATKLKIIDEHVVDTVPAPSPPDFDIAPTRKRHAGWTAERQRRFIEQLALTGSVGEACAAVAVASSSAYRLRNKAGAEGFARAWDAALRLSATRLAAIALDRAVNGRVERFYKDGELVVERRMPSDYMLTWLLSRLDPLQFGPPSAKALAVATGDPRDKARNELPELLEAFEDVSQAECAVEPIDYLDDRLGRPAAANRSATSSAAERDDSRAHAWTAAIAAFRLSHRAERRLCRAKVSFCRRDGESRPAGRGSRTRSTSRVYFVTSTAPVLNRLLEVSLSSKVRDVVEGAVRAPDSQTDQHQHYAFDNRNCLPHVSAPRPSSKLLCRSPLPLSARRPYELWLGPYRPNSVPFWKGGTSNPRLIALARNRFDAK